MSISDCCMFEIITPITTPYKESEAPPFSIRRGGVNDWIDVSGKYC